MSDIDKIRQAEVERARLDQQIQKTFQSDTIRRAVLSVMPQPELIKKVVELNTENAIQRAEIASLKLQIERMGRVVEAARAFDKQYDIVAPEIDGAFVMAHIHGQNYTGPTIEKEREALKLALREIDGGGA